MMVSIHITYKEYNTFYQITPYIYDFVNGCNHGYKAFMTFRSGMRLYFTRMVLQPQGIHNFGHMKIHMR
jgi:hypothetical protein